MMTSGSIVIPRWVATWMFAGTYTAEAPIGRFQILSREKGQRSGSRPPGGPPPGGGGFEVTVTEIEVVWRSEPLVPVTVTVYDPAVAPVIVHVEDWLPLTDNGEQEPLTPGGAARGLERDRRGR